MPKFSTVQELHLAAQSNPKSLNAWWQNCKRFKKNDELCAVHQILDATQIQNICEAIYEKLNPRPLCICGKPVLFKTYPRGYRTYCGLSCSRSDGSKTPYESRVRGVARRRKTMIDRIFSDPKRNLEYRSKLSAASKLRMCTPEARANKSSEMKKAIADGRFTPNITNSWTRWAVSYRGKKFRSSWEAIFYAYHNGDIEYETLRIPYEFEGKSRTYIVDFVDHRQKKAYEIKPSTLMDSPLNFAKAAALQEWCKINSYDQITVSEIQIRPMFDVVSKFDDELFVKIRKAYRW